MNAILFAKTFVYGSAFAAFAYIIIVCASLNASITP